MSTANSNLQEVFNNSYANEILNLIKTHYNSLEDIRIFLFDRRHSHFVEYISERGVAVALEQEIADFARKYFFKNKSVYFHNLKALGALIASNMYSIGYLVIQTDGKTNDSDGKLIDLPITDMETQVLDHYGALYGHVVLRNIHHNLQFLSYSDLRNFEKEIDPYLPLGKNEFCTTVFVDIRGLSNIINYDKNYISFVRDFSSIVKDISSRHYGCVNGHFGGGMLITFNQLINEKESFSSTRAACTIKKIQSGFEQLVTKKYSRSTTPSLRNLKANLFIGIGSSTGESYYSTFGFGTGMFYTPLGIEIGRAKKVEGLSGRKHSVLANTALATEEFINSFGEGEDCPFDWDEVKGVSDLYPKPYEIKNFHREKCPIPSDKKCFDCLECKY